MATSTTVRTAKVVKDTLLTPNGIKLTYADYIVAFGLEDVVKVTASTPVPGADSTILRKAKQYLARQNSTDAASDSTENDDDNGEIKAPKPGSVGELAFQYHDLGFERASVNLIDSWFPSFKGKKPKLYGRMIPTSEQRTAIVDTFNVLMAVRKQLETDQAMLESWTVPNPGEMVGQEVYTYIGICGHSTQISRRMVVDRLSNQNSKVPPFFRLCADCRAQRVALLNMVPGAAQADSVCSVCHEPTFATGANGLAKSRADIWENLLSGVLAPLNLPLRLRPDHLDSSGKHQALVRSREEFEAWKEEYILNVGFAISAHPELGAELKARMEGEIEAKRLELGLPKEDTTEKNSTKRGRGRK